MKLKEIFDQFAMMGRTLLLKKAILNAYERDIIKEIVYCHFETKPVKSNILNLFTTILKKHSVIL